MARREITQAARRIVAARDGLTQGGTAQTACHYCDTPLMWSWTDKRVRLLDANGRSTPEIDHVISVFHGGTDDPDNLVPACLLCNRSKNYRSAAHRLAKQVAKPKLSDAGQPRPDPTRHP